jgi:peroxin-10
LTFPLASQPDIVRASQKDEYFKKQLNDNLFELVQYYLGPRTAMKVQEDVNLAAQLCYYGMSTLMGRQTLGEEYCDTVQVDGKRIIPSSTLQRFLLIFTQILIPYGCSKLSVHIERFLRPRVQTLSGEEPLKEATRKKFAAWLPRLRSILSIIQRLHIAVFYFQGIYYHIPKRLVNIKYVFNRKIDEERPTYDILGIFIVLQLAISFGLWIKDSLAKRGDTPQVEGEDSESGHELSTSNGTCSLCLGPRKVTTATSCGHLFCWSCISEWCNSKPECPLCRTPQRTGDLLPVYHFG